MSRRTLQKRHYVKGPLSKQTKAGIGGFTSGASASFKKGPGVPGTKKKRKAWYEGPPMRHVGGEATVSSRFATKLG